MLVSLWALTHRYQGFARDGELYAIQASARLNPALGVDVYLESTSQDRYTIFSRIYAAVIQFFGLQEAGIALFALCTTGFLTAAWVLARELLDGEIAWATVAALIGTIGYYGAYRILHDFFAGAVAGAGDLWGLCNCLRRVLVCQRIARH